MALQDVLAEIAVNLRLDSAEYSAGVSKAEATTSRLERRLTAFSGKAGGIGKALAGVGGALAGGFVASLGVDAIMRAVTASLEYAGSLGEVSQQLGVTTRDLQVFRYAAGQNGVSSAQLETGLSKLTITLGKLAAGAKEPAKALGAIGISADQLKGKDTGEALRIIADGLAPVADRAQRAAVEVALFGKSGAQLDPLLSGGSAAINELARAADELGIVLSDEQIRKADETADKLEALKTVLSARIAGVVADNTGAILGLANAFARLASDISWAIQKVVEFRAKFDARVYENLGNHAAAARSRGLPFESGRTPSLAGQTVTVQLAPAALPKPPTPTGGDIGQFLAGGGGGRGGKRDRSAEDAQRKRVEALREAHDFDQEILRAQQSLLQAQQDLEADFIERSNIGVQLLDLDRRAYAAQLAHEVELHKITKGAEGRSQAQADQLLALYDQTDLIKRQLAGAELEESRQREFNRFEALTFDLARQKLADEMALADTAAERRDIERRIIDLAFREERERLDRIIAESRDWREIEEARRRLAELPAEQARARRIGDASTRGPMEDYLARLPTTAAKAQEALEQLQVQGLEGLIDSALALSDGLDAAAESLLATVKNFLLGLLRMELQQGMASLIKSTDGFFGLLSGVRAHGGPVLAGHAYLVGEKGPEIFRPSHSGRVISNADSRRLAGGAPRAPIVQNWYVQTPNADSFRRSERQILTAARRRLG